MMVKVILKQGREKALERFHPWVFSGAIERIEGKVHNGDSVHVVNKEGAVLGIGHWSEGSIAVKVLAFHEGEINDAWYSEHLTNSMRVRKELGFPSEHTNAYRLVHGEGDGMPGLIIDVYANVAVVQPHSAGMQRALPSITAALEHLGFPNVVHKPVNKEKPEIIVGSVSERTLIQENGTLFQVDILAGQKTGFFLDQRDNRALVRHYAKSKSVLNVFSYTGGFSMAAIAGGAASAISLDSAASALSLADANAQLNNMADRHRTLRMDAVPYLEGMDEKFDLIVLDPPAFAKHMSARSNAIQAYRRINAAALNALKPGGILFTFSCSQVVDRQQFYDTVASAAIQVKRSARVLHHLRQPCDHPVSIFHPEGEYLKGLALMVE